MSSVQIHSQVTIHRPVSEVAALFEDLRVRLQWRTERGRVAREWTQRVGGGRFLERSLLLGRTQEDWYDYTWDAQAGARQWVVQGPNLGAVAHYRWDALGAELTALHLEMDFPLRGSFRMLAPLVRASLLKDVREELEWARQLLESGHSSGSSFTRLHP